MAKDKRRLEALRKAHAATPAGHTPRVEDYVEVIYELIHEKGYARIVDISQHLNVSSPTVTKMIQRLHEDRLVVYERYRGVTLAPEGEALAKEVRHRHGVIMGLLRAIGVDESTAHRDTEGMEHHLTPSTVDDIADLVAFIEKNPEWWDRYRKRDADG